MKGGGPENLMSGMSGGNKARRCETRRGTLALPDLPAKVPILKPGATMNWERWGTGYLFPASYAIRTP